MAHDAAPREPRDRPRAPAGATTNRPAAVVAALVDLARPVERQRATRGGEGTTARRARTIRAPERSGLAAGLGWLAAEGVRARLPQASSADGLGAGLVAVLAAWTVIGAGSGPDEASSVLWLSGGVAALYAMGRWVTEREPLAVHRIVALAVGGSIVLTLPGVVRAGGAPLGYANANAALGGLGALAALGVAVAEPTQRLRVAWAALAGGLVLAVIATGSHAGAIALLVGAALLAVSALLRRPAAVVLGGAVAVVAVLGVTAVIAHGADPAGLGDRSGVRGELWGAAAELTAAHPLRGVGVGGFEEQNPVSGDADLRWAHHGYLQMGAETGLIGLSLLLAVVGWTYARLGLAAVQAPHRAALGAAALTLVALHATVDHVLHHPALVLTLAAMVGAATARPPRRDPGTRGSRRPPR